MEAVAVDFNCKASADKDVKSENVVLRIYRGVSPTTDLWQLDQDIR